MMIVMFSLHVLIFTYPINTDKQGMLEQFAPTYYVCLTVITHTRSVQVAHILTPVYMTLYIIIYIVHESHPRQLIFLRKSDCLGCAVLLCLVVCLTLLASFFLPSAFLINMYIYLRV